MANKMLLAIIAVLVIVIIAILYYFLIMAQPASAVKASQQDVENKEAAQKASSDVASGVGDLQKGLLDIKNNLP